MSQILYKAAVFFWKHFVERQNSTQNFKETLDMLGLKEFEIFFSPHLAANDDLPSMAVTSSVSEDALYSNPKIKMSAFPNLKQNALKHLGLISLFALISACAGIGGPVGGGSIDGAGLSGNGVQSTPFGGNNFTGSGTTDGSKAKDKAATEGDFNNSGGGGNSGGGTTAGGDSPQSLPQSSIPPPMLKKINVYASDAQGTTPVIGSADAVDASVSNEDHMVVISTDPIEDIVARVEKIRLQELALRKAEPKTFNKLTSQHPLLASLTQWQYKVGQTLINHTLALLNKAGILTDNAYAAAGRPQIFLPDIRENVAPPKELCDQDDVTCCEITSATSNKNDGSFECYVKPTMTLINTPEVPYHIYIAEKADTQAGTIDLAFSDAREDTMNLSLRWLADAPKDLKASAMGDEDSGVYSLTNDVTLQLNDIPDSDVPLRVFGEYKNKYAKFDTQGAERIAVDATGLAYLSDDGVSTLDVLGGAANWMNHMSVEDLAIAKPDLIKSDLIKSDNNQIIYTASPKFFKCKPNQTIDCINPDTFDQRISALHLISSDPKITDKNILLKAGNGCGDLKKLIGFGSNNGSSDNKFYPVIYQDANDQTCALITSSPKSKLSGESHIISNESFDLVDLDIYKDATSTNEGKIIALNDRNQLLIANFQTSSLSPETNRLNIKQQFNFPENYAVRSITFNKDDNIAYVLSERTDTNKTTAAKQNSDTVQDQVSVFNLRPELDTPEYLGDFNINKAVLGDKDLAVKATNLTFYKDAFDLKHVIIGTQGLKGAIVLPEENLRTPDQPNSRMKFTTYSNRGYVAPVPTKPAGTTLPVRPTPTSQTGIRN